MDQIHLSPLVDQIQLTLGHISNNFIITGRPAGRHLFDWIPRSVSNSPMQAKHNSSPSSDSCILEL
jgi:hypothetical protein